MRLGVYSRLNFDSWVTGPARLWSALTGADGTGQIAATTDFMCKDN